MSDVLIIGNGPSGVSCSLYTSRAGLSTTIIGKDFGALSKAEKIENYYGFPTPVSGTELIERGLIQAKNLGVDVISDEVVSIGYDGEFTVKTKFGDYSAAALVLATGSKRAAPPIKGLTELEGKGVSYCAVCDAFFYKRKDVCVLGCCDYALSEATELISIANSVTILTNGAKPSDSIPSSIKVITTPISELIEKDEKLSRVVFKDNTSIEVAGLFVAVGVAGSADFAKKLGLETSGSNIVTNENMMTNIPGIFAIGDCTGGVLQIAKAVYDGAKAGLEVIKFLRNKK